MIELTIPGQPIGKQRPRIAHTRSRAFMYEPTKTMNYEIYVKELFIIKYPDFKPIEGPVRMTLMAFVKIPKASIKKTEAMESGEIRPTKKPDASNILKVVEDALNNLAYQDDKQIVEARIGKRYSSQPRIELTIEEVNHE